jgi:Fe2+-dicitrate sensor, membrane component
VTAADRDRVEEEAALWLIRLSEEPDDADLRAAFAAWRGESALNAEMWARTSRAYDLAGKGTPRHPEHWRAPTAVPPARFRVRRAASGLALAALAAGLAVLLLPGLLLRLQADHVSGTAEIQTIALDDGSRIRLAPESAVAVAFSGDGRRVRLLRGQAFFEVAPDGTRPFSVSAGEMRATVLGTAFEVRLGEQGAAVAVRRGHVRVDDSGASPSLSEHLHGGEWLRVARHGAAARGTANPEDVADWLRGELVVRDRPVGEVIDELRRYHRGAILVQGDVFARRRVSGIYGLRDPAETLRGLAASHGATLHRISPWLLVVTAK